jgi:urease accessory protein
MIFPMFAHPMPTNSGAVEGFLHPLLGIDHLLAMLTVGLLSAQLGGRAIWTVPVTFVSVMALGGLGGILGLQLPLVEYGIALSVIVLGIALLARRKIPEAIAMLFVGMFAMFHGHAHGAEIPNASGESMFVAAYVLGFLTATAGLHVVGALLGYIALRSHKGARMLRIAGVAIAAIGVFIFINIGA